MKFKSREFSTKAIHGTDDRAQLSGALNTPIFLNSTFAFRSAAALAACFTGDSSAFLYHRVSNPTVTVLEERLAALEGGQAGLVTSSGMAAIAALLWSHLSAGDEIVADRTLYGCTHALLSLHLAKFGVQTHFIDMCDYEAFTSALSPRTRIAFCESPANPTMRIIDIERVGEKCRRNGTMLVVDNTCATPYLQQPLALGAHVVVHSATKYLGGHGDLVAGAIVATHEVIRQARLVGVKEMTGGSTSAFDAFLVLRGLKTLAVRMEQHCNAAEYVAERLADRPEVNALYYPGSLGPAQSDLAARQMRRLGGLLGIELTGGAPAARTFLDHLRLTSRAVSLGSAETLAQHPASMTHANYAPQALAEAGIGSGFVRMSLGLEHPADIWADIEHALSAVTNLERSDAQ